MVAASTDDAETRTYSFYRGSSASVLGSDTKFSTSTEVLNEYSDETENNLSVRSDDPDLSGADRLICKPPQGNRHSENFPEHFAGAVVQMLCSKSDHESC